MNAVAAATAPKVGLLVGRERSFPDALIAEVNRRGAGVTALRNLRYPLGWDALVTALGFPMYLKPHWGGGWKDVYKVDSREDLFRVYDKTGGLTMIAQEAIEWTQYVRCIVVGREHVLPAAWDPRLSHFDRYRRAHETMPSLSAALTERVVRDARAICGALGYDMNTVEFAVRDGVPYAIDMMNSAPDFDITSLSDEHFAWTVGKMADLVVELPRRPRGDARSSQDALVAR